MIRLDGVTVTYSAATTIGPCTLALRRGDLTVLVGSSGAGKSTLLRCMNGLILPTSGRVEVDGLGSLADPRVRRAHQRRTGMIFQSHQLIGRHTALENVLIGRLGYHSFLRSLFPPSRFETRKALQCLERVDLLGKAHARADQLSGGERQRVGIARALVQEPTLILADEPVASLDPVHGERVLTLLHRICREDGLTAAMSLHQLDFVRRFSDRVLGLSGGRIVFDGAAGALTPESLGGIYRSPGPRDDRELSPQESLKEAI
ncbi:MAG TPA: phosphonate ABC transporter ATP-binding protein [Planctomycetota bacterium]|nr:phosphonate ABC transporter ATP-binding protein [Planctomycetota bacterium]